MLPKSTLRGDRLNVPVQIVLRPKGAPYGTFLSVFLAASKELLRYNLAAKIGYSLQRLLVS